MLFAEGFQGGTEKILCFTGLLQTPWLRTLLPALAETALQHFTVVELKTKQINPKQQQKSKPNEPTNQNKLQTKTNKKTHKQINFKK